MTPRRGREIEQHTSLTRNAEQAQTLDAEGPSREAPLCWQAPPGGLYGATGCLEPQAAPPGWRARP